MVSHAAEVKLKYCQMDAITEHGFIIRKAIKLLSFVVRLLSCFTVIGLAVSDVIG